MSYTIEVYRGNQKAEKHLGYFANYVLFFPQMVAGPIEKYATLGQELKKKVELVYENFSSGFRLILFGLFIKMAIADNVAPIVNQVYENPSSFNSLEIFIAILLFSIQIYADFYGYSTIAIGAAKLMGINLIDNFKTPYLTRSVNEFWKGWHISLTSWFREYLFIPLGGSRVGYARWIINIMIIFLVSGLWHGANWTFVIWGGLHGIVYLTERGFNKLFKFKLNENFSLLNLVLGIKNFLVVSFIWVFFRAESFEKVKMIFQGLIHNTNIPEYKLHYNYSLMFAITLIATDVVLKKNRVDSYLEKKSTFVRWAIYSVLLFGLLAMSGIENLPFIYFQF
ncbi:MAG: MBOAT family protein [Bacteroidetes bacterium]|nr:MBOAT family protein [Bacteroidota bacterium]